MNLQQHLLPPSYPLLLVLTEIALEMVMVADDVADACM